MARKQRKTKGKEAPAQTPQESEEATDTAGGEEPQPEFDVNQLPPGILAWNISSLGYAGGAAQLFAGGLGMFSVISTCDVGGGADFSRSCSNFASYSNFVLFASAVFHVVFVLTHMYPRAQAVVVYYGLAAVAGGLGQAVVLRYLFGPSLSDGNTYLFGLLPGEWIRVGYPLVLMWVIIVHRRQLFRVIFYDKLARIDEPHLKRLAGVFHTSSPLLLFTAWCWLFKPAVYELTDVAFWPGTGAVLATTLVLGCALWFFLAFNSFFGPIMWQMYARQGIMHLRKGRELTPVVLF